MYMPMCMYVGTYIIIYSVMKCHENRQSPKSKISSSIYSYTEYYCDNYLLYYEKSSNEEQKTSVRSSIYPALSPVFQNVLFIIFRHFFPKEKGTLAFYDPFCANAQDPGKTYGVVTMISVFTKP